jgi:hypothetical protein
MALMLTALLTAYADANFALKAIKIEKISWVKLAVFLLLLLLIYTV